MAKTFKSKRKLRKLWILKSIFLIILVYILIKLCIYSLVDISPISYFKIETVGHEFTFITHIKKRGMLLKEMCLMLLKI